MLKSPLSPATVDQTTVDYYVAKGRRERSRAFTAMIKSLFSSPGASRKSPATLSGHRQSHA